MSVPTAPTTGNVLIVEDDPDTREMLAALLATEGFHAVGAEDGLEALHLLRTVRHRAPEAPRLVLLDLKMPKVDGLEVLRQLKNDPELRRIPVVMMTSSREEQDLVRSYDLGVNSYITKPVTFKSLVEIIKVLGRYWFEVVELPADEN